MFVGLMDKLGIADAINKNAVLWQGGYDVPCGWPMAGPISGRLSFTKPCP